jgi:prepilin-type N-terminal cleavage/methylation domain-containing protein
MFSRTIIRRTAQRGFSLIEMLVAVGLLSVVILALYAMFDQTQRALRSSVGQVDVFEGSRSALELMSKDLEHARPAGVFDGPHFVTRLSVAPNLIEDQDALCEQLAQANFDAGCRQCDGHEGGSALVRGEEG